MKNLLSYVSSVTRGGISKIVGGSWKLDGGVLFLVFNGYGVSFMILSVLLKFVNLRFRYLVIFVALCTVGVAGSRVAVYSVQLLSSAPADSPVEPQTPFPRAAPGLLKFSSDSP